MSQPRPTPVARFLGPAHAAGGPLALLGLGPEGLDDEAILAALDRAIDRVAQHPQRDTPEADEVRLALHAAAAQLLDPAVRRHVVARWGVPPPSAPVEQPRPSPAPPPPTPARVPAAQPRAAAAPTWPRALERDAFLVIGTAGGWTPAAQRHLLMIAHARGVPTSDVVALVTSLGRRPAERSRGPRTAAPSPVMSAGVSAEPEDPAYAALRRLLGVAGLVVLGMTVATVLLVMALSGRRDETPADAPPVVAKAPSVPPPPPSAKEANAARTPAPAPAPPAVEARVPAPADLVALLGELRRSGDQAGTDPQGATERFEKAMAAMGSAWPGLTEDLLAGATDAVVEVLYRLGPRPELVARAAEAALGPAGAITAEMPAEAAQVLPSIWAAGLAARLSRETDLPAAVRARARAAAPVPPSGAVPDATFEHGRLAAISAWPSRLAGPDGVAPVAAWRAWMTAVDATGIDDPPTRVRLVLTAAESLLVRGPEPDRDTAASAAIGELLTRLAWREDEGSRPWLLRWFDDRRLTAADLRAVTGAVALRSAAEGVEAGMVLPAGASDAARTALRDRYAQAWGSSGDSRPSPGAAGAWAVAARAALDRATQAATREQRVRALAALAGVNEGAVWAWKGDASEGARLAEDALRTTEAPKAPAPAGPAQGALIPEGGSWAERMLAARQNPKARREALAALGSQGGRLGAADAEALVLEAQTGTTETRSLAADAIRARGADPAVVNALLERQPSIARTAANTALLEAVTRRTLLPPRDPEWPIAARRALVERLNDLLAAGGGGAELDRLATRVAVSYRGMAAGAPLTGDQRREAEQPSASLSAAALYQALRSQADRLLPPTPPAVTADAADRLRAARMAQARGPIQQFAAQQVAVAEILSYATHADRPGAAEAIAGILAELREARRAASTVTDQLVATEAAITRLWLIRLQEAAP